LELSDVEFTAVNPESWLDPDNWCATSTELADCQPNSPIDTENVPCVNDDVVFLRQRSYYVDISQGLNVTVKSLKITGTVSKIGPRKKTILTNSPSPCFEDRNANTNT
jgi:hypothetical protein